MTATRREFVAMLLGAPLAAAAGGGGAPRIPPGALVDPGQRRGHAAVRDLRDAAGIVPAAWRRHRVVVIGAAWPG